MANPEAVGARPAASKGRIVPFGKYLLLQRVSVGGMAEVFKAVPEGATRVDQIIAIKRILPSIAEDAEFIGMFVDEAKLSGQLTHPNICRIYELGAVGDAHYIAMQFLWGRDLLKVMNRFRRAGQAVPPPMAAWIAARAGAGLHYAHTKCDENGQPLNIIHRDVSPQNIIVGYSGGVKVIDFGVAKAASQNQKTQAGILKGKFGYMSPEMIRGLPVDHRSDVFAMGICLWEALAGARLFYGETDFATLEMVREANVPPPSSKADGIPPALEEICMKALSPTSDTRYPSAAAMEAALDGFLAEHYPGFGEEQVGAYMKEAFAPEVAREKQRLQIFSSMMDQGSLTRGASLPPLPTEPRPTPSETNEAAGSDLQATVVSPVSEEALAKLNDEYGDMQEEATRIFFSAEELEEIRELEAPAAPAPTEDPDPTTRAPGISDLILRHNTLPPALAPAPGVDYGAYPPSSNSHPIVGGPTPSGSFPHVHPGDSVPLGSAASPVPQAHGAVPTMSIPTAPATAMTHRPTAASKGGARAAWFVPLALLLVALGYLVARLATPSTGVLEIAAVGDPSAMVHVDAIMRGHPPLRIESLKPGPHTVRVDARGYEPAEREVYVQAGVVTPVSLVLERSEPAVKVAPIEPDPQAARPMPDAVPETVEAPPARPPREPPQPKRRDVADSVDREPPKSRDADDLRRRTRERMLRQEEPTTAVVAPEQPQVPAPEPASAPERAAKPTGSLLISTLPWSRVFIDGRDTGRDTPVRELKVSPGTHVIGLRTPDGVMHEVKVDIEAGARKKIIRRF